MHRDETKLLCMYTDASDSLWSGFLTQNSEAELSLPHKDQNHEQLAFISDRFSGAQIEQSTLKKEAFTVFALIERSHWLLACSDGFDL